ncbi:MULTISPECIES: DUF6850 family outer membrane beta-barrel protein [Chitinophagaceae]
MESSIRIESLLYADRIFYLNHGYGYITVKDQSIYQRRRNYSGIGLNAQNSFGNWTVLGSFDYFKRHDGNTAERYASSHLSYYSKWDLETWNMRLFAEKKGLRSTQQWSLDGTYQTGRNWDSIFNASNYQYSHQLLKIKYAYLPLTHTKMQLGWDVHIGCKTIEDAKDRLSLLSLSKRS